MKKRLVLKPFVIPMLYSIFAVVVIVSLFLSIEVIDEKDSVTYVNDSILDEYVPVVNIEEEKVKKTFTDQNYYDYKATDEEQTNSILYHENTYIQNTGINYQGENTFDVISILSGEVIEVEEKELLGKSVTIRHDNELISVYQSLSNVTVKKGDKVTTGQVIAKSGSCSLITDSKNNLHFELYVNGTIADPENYYDKKLSEF